MIEWIGIALAAAVVVSLIASIASLFGQARLGDQADARKPWRWLLVACTVGLAMTIAAAVDSRWSVRSIGAIVPFALLAPLAVAGSTGALYRKRRKSEP